MPPTITAMEQTRAVRPGSRQAAGPSFMLPTTTPMKARFQKVDTEAGSPKRPLRFSTAVSPAVRLTRPR